MTRKEVIRRKRIRRRRKFRKIMNFVQISTIIILLCYILLNPMGTEDAKQQVVLAEPAPTLVASSQEANILPTATALPTKIPYDKYVGDKITPSPIPQEPGVAIAGLTVIEILKDSETAGIELYNPLENEGWYYLSYELRLLENPRDEETGELIIPEKPTEDSGDIEESAYITVFQTGLIPPGKYCNGVDILYQLEPGIYDAFLFVQPYRMDEAQTPTNNANLQVRLIVK